MVREKKSERHGQKYIILGSNPEGEVKQDWCVKQDSFDSCILLSGQISIKKEGIF